MAGRAGGRHPKAAGTVVRLTNDAVRDLERLMDRGDPQVVRWAFKKMLHLEQNPEAGDALLGGLMGWRKITVGDRTWRLAWRVTHDAVGAVVVDVAKIWVFGARSALRSTRRWKPVSPPRRTHRTPRRWPTCWPLSAARLTTSKPRRSPRRPGRHRSGCRRPCCTWSESRPPRLTR